MSSAEFTLGEAVNVRKRGESTLVTLPCGALGGLVEGRPVARCVVSVHDTCVSLVSMLG